MRSGRIAATCGAFVGAVITLGLCGIDDPPTVQLVARKQYEQDVLSMENTDNAETGA